MYRDPLTCIVACLSAIFALVIFTVGLLHTGDNCAREQPVRLSTWLLVYAILLLLGVLLSALANVRDVCARISWFILAAVWIGWIVLGAIMVMGGASDCKGALYGFAITALIIGFILMLGATCMLVSISSAREATYDALRTHSAQQNMHDARKYALNRQQNPPAKVIGAQHTSSVTKNYKFIDPTKSITSMP